jgi:hypothetical protein
MADFITVLPDRIVVDDQGNYWRDLGDGTYSMCPTSSGNQPIGIVASYVVDKSAEFTDCDCKDKAHAGIVGDPFPGHALGCPLRKKLDPEAIRALSDIVNQPHPRMEQPRSRRIKNPWKKVLR